MSLFDTAAAGIRLQLFEADPQLKTKIVRDHYTVRGELPIGVCLHRVKHQDPVIGIRAAEDWPGGFAIWIEPPGDRRGLIYATRADVVPLTGAAAGLFLSPPTGLPTTRIDRWNSFAAVTTFHTWPAAQARGEEAVRKYCILMEPPLFASPRTGDLFDDPKFWMLVGAVRRNPKSDADAGALADFVQEHDFDRLAEALWNDRPTAIQLLPTAAAHPSRFVKQRLPATNGTR